MVLKINSEGVVKAYGNLDEFAKKAKKVESETKKVEKSTMSLNDVFSQLNLTSIATTAGVMGLFKAFTSLTGAVSGFVSNSMKVYSGFETIQTGLATVMQSAEKGKEAFEDLRKFSNETTFGVDELANASTQLMNVGMSFDMVKDKLRQLGDLSGGSKEKFADLVSIYSKISSTGKASAIQLNQLALRGIPVIQMLKDMGVQGHATAEDIEKVFTRLTEAGGQFHGAMENILQTIEGKQGEIGDFWKEFTVSFAEASGLVVVYKKALDGVRDVIIKMADSMKIINDNPILKAILQGALLGALVAIGGTLMSVIVPAMGAIVTKMMAMAGITTLLNPTVLAIAGITAGVVALTAVVSNHIKKQKELEEENQKMLDDALVKSEKFKDLELEKSGGTGYSNEIKKTVSDLAKVNNQLSIIERQVQDMVECGEDLESTDTSVLDNLRQQSAELENKLRFLREEEKMQQKLLEVERQRRQASETAKQNFEENLENIRKQYDKIKNKDVESQIAQLERMKNASYTEKFYQNIGGTMKQMERTVVMSSEDKDKIDTIIEELKKKNDDKDSWQKRFKSVTGTDVSEFTNGRDASNKYVNSLLESNKTAQYIAELMGEAYSTQDKINAEQSIYEKLKKDYVELVKNGFEVTDNSMQELLKWIERQKRNLTLAKNNALVNSPKENYEKNKAVENRLYGSNSTSENRRLNETRKNLEEYMASVYERAKRSYEQSDMLKAIWDNSFDNYYDFLLDTDKTYGKLVENFESAKSEANRWDLTGMVKDFTKSIGDKLKSGEISGSTIGGYAIGAGANAVASASGDFNNFAQGFAMGGPIGGVISALVGAFMNVAGSVEGFDKAMNPVTHLMQSLKPLITLVVKVLDDLVDNLESGATALIDLLNMIAPVLKIISVVLRALAVPLKLINKFLIILNAVLKPIIDALVGFLDWLLGGLDDLDETLGFVNDELTETKDNLKELNSAYTSLLENIRAYEEYYIEKRRQLNAQNEIEKLTGVNDMILTPHGNFSTHPDDYIIATKNPYSLGGGVTMNVSVVNEAGDVANATARQTTDMNGNPQLFVMISRKIAQDVSLGANGWDKALSSRESRISGTRLSL